LVRAQQECGQPRAAQTCAGSGRVPAHLQAQG